MSRECHGSQDGGEKPAAGAAALAAHIRVVQRSKMTFFMESPPIFRILNILYREKSEKAVELCRMRKICRKRRKLDGFLVILLLYSNKTKEKSTYLFQYCRA